MELCVVISKKDIKKHLKHFRMKRTLYTLAVAGALLLNASCSSDYLDVQQGSGLDKADVLSSTTSIAKAVNGMSKLMSMQYHVEGAGQTKKDNKYNGEGTIKTWYGNFLGNDYMRNNYTALAFIVNGTKMQDPTALYDMYPWHYYYSIISNANNIIPAVDNASGDLYDKYFLKAEALTFRAYSYMMLVQLYGDRWMNSDNGKTEAVVLRLTPSTDVLPVASLADCYKQIYQDLDDAIELYKKSGKDRKQGCNYLPNINVAYATYARAAINREDWATAAQYAKLAREGYPLMTADEYVNGGFNQPNQEWIWSAYSDEQESLYYYQFFAYEGSNSPFSSFLSRPASISKELYDRIPATDVRRGMFLDPKDDAYTASNNYGQAALRARAINEYANKMYVDNGTLKSYVFAYMQYKHQAKYAPGVGELNIFRSSEMYLIEAEAYCHMGADHEQDARNLLVELNKTSGRDADYACTKTGSDLLEEVRLYNRIELWGEGHDWFNYKRWGLPIVRRTAAAGGNFPTAFAVTINPEDNNGWKWIIPDGERDMFTNE